MIEVLGKEGGFVSYIPEMAGPQGHPSVMGADFQGLNRVLEALKGHVLLEPNERCPWEGGRICVVHSRDGWTTGPSFSYGG